MGIGSVAALPLRLRNVTIGALNLLRTSTGSLTAEDRLIAQALADVATIGILQYRTTEEHRVLAAQLQRANEIRLIIEQAKGVFAERSGLDVDVAFTAMRQYARRHHERLADTAAALVYRDIGIDDILEQAQPEERR